MIHDAGNRKRTVNFSLIRRTLWKWPAFDKKYLCIQGRRVRRLSFQCPRLIAPDPWIIPTLCPIKVFLPSLDIGNNGFDSQFFCRRSSVSAETAGIISFFWFEAKRDIVPNEAASLLFLYGFDLFISFDKALCFVDQT